MPEREAWGHAHQDKFVDT